jgi:IS4 transposase
MQPLHPTLGCHQEREPPTGGQDPRLGRVEGLHHQSEVGGPEFVIDAYRQLWHIEKSFRMSKYDLQARPIYHHWRDSIEART